MSKFVVPGDGPLTTTLIRDSIKESSAENETESNRNIKLGPGLIRSGELFCPLYAGYLGCAAGNRFWLEYEQKSYVPVVGDHVIGTVKAILPDQYRIEIGYHVWGILDNLSFEGATKRNRPQLNIGSIVYARVVLANRDIEPELSCLLESGKAGPFGPLSVDGHHMKLNSMLAKHLLFNPDARLLKELEHERLSFDMAVGINGFIWILGADIVQTHFLVLFLQLAQRQIKCWDSNSAILEASIKECITRAKALSSLS